MTYGATQSNWLANIDEGDTIFLSQFNYKSQYLFGPFRVTRKLFYNKFVIYPSQRYFYRIQFKPTTPKTKIIEETDLYLYAIQYNNIPDYFKIINLIQQNKHLHCISLNNSEGKAIYDTFLQFGLNYDYDHRVKLTGNLTDVNCEYVWQKNKLDKKYLFSSESDLEAYLILALKNTKAKEYQNINKLLRKFDDNELYSSYIYNQFIFGNAYPSDVTIINMDNINVFELKKDALSNNSIAQIEKELKKHLYYSLFSNRLQSKNPKRFNFYLAYLKHENNGAFRQLIFKKYEDLCKKIDSQRENSLTLVEYSIKNDALILEEAKP